MQCIAIRHLQFEDLGIFAEVLIEQGFDITYIDAGMAQFDLSTCHAADLVIILGGPIGVYEASIYPWLTTEIEYVAQRIRQNLPVLGICLGAQIIAAALGAAVYPGKAKEIAWSPLQLAQAAENSFLSALAHVDVLHWHGDTFDLPLGATLLASTALTPHQAFSYGAHTLALQFHAEAHGDKMEPWLIGHTVELHLAGVDIPKLRANGKHNALSKASAGKNMLRQWLRQIGLTE
ncbi:glutamine amidotransferase [Deefgea piscis]|uniref:Glutamine amidotransferase n=1 Tax=Deefgea piscis TaxID=2739061 RepID=A0A6M8SPD6_9NEIS|nr:glutamine amidotransferase [Deefgea piscis]QKJ66571.1 glutamine amidotransferase [Deefgea piscis]